MSLCRGDPRLSSRGICEESVLFSLLLHYWFPEVLSTHQIYRLVLFWRKHCCAGARIKTGIKDNSDFLNMSKQKCLRKTFVFVGVPGILVFCTSVHQ